MIGEIIAYLVVGGLPAASIIGLLLVSTSERGEDYNG